MILEHRSLETFEGYLRNAIESYSNGDCDLEEVLDAADKVACYKANVGISNRRLEYNEREMAFHEQWLQDNAPVSGVNNGHGLLQDLFIGRENNTTPVFNQRVIEEMSNRDRMIVATVIQWLGSNCGMCFLSEALARFGAKIVETKFDKPE